MLSVLGPVLLKKMMYAPLFSALEILLWHAKRRFNRGGYNPRRRTQLPSWWVDARGRSNTAAAAAEDESSPDPMRRLVWFETALVFGGLVPLLLPLLALQLHTDARVFGWALRKRSSGSGDANGSTATAATKPVLRQAMLVHAVLVLFMHSVLVSFFFLDSSVHGAAGLIAVLVVIWMAFVLSMCWRISTWDLLRCRLRPQRERIGGVDGALFRDPLLEHMRDNQILEERRGFLAVLCVVAVVGFCVWGLFVLRGWA